MGKQSEQIDPNDATETPMQVEALGFDRGCPVGDPAEVELMPGIKVWLVTRYSDVSDALTSSDVGVRVPEAVEDLIDAGRLPAAYREAFSEDRKNLLNTDPPEHTTLRAEITKQLTPQRMAALHDEIGSGADRFVGKISSPLGPAVDIMQELAYPLSIIAVCGLLGIPEADRDTFLGWAQTISVGGGGPEGYQAVFVAMAEIDTYFGQLLEDKSFIDGDSLAAGIIQSNARSGSMSVAQLKTMLAMLVMSGLETAASLTGTAIAIILRDSVRRELFLSNLSFAGAFVEETIRFAGPVTFTPPRFTRSDFALGATVIPAGEPVSMSLWSANRDPSRFHEAASFNPMRSERSQLGFGRGAHYCLGAAIARSEAKAALIALFGAHPDIEHERTVWRNSNLRGPVSLLVGVR